MKKYLMIGFCLHLSIILALSTLCLAQIDQEDLKDESIIIIAFEKAVETFKSIYQSSSILEFERIINIIQQKRAVAEITPELQNILLRSYEYRARAFFNSGQAGKASDDFAEIIKLDQKYMVDANLVSPKIIELFEKVKRDNIGYIVVKSEPAGANIRLNGQVIGVTNLFQTPYLKGAYQLEVELLGYKKESRMINIMPQQTLEISLELERNTAAAYFVTQPPDVEILMDGKSYGMTAGPPDPSYMEKAEELGLDFSQISTEFKIANISLGTHIIEFRKECYESVEKRLSFDSPDDYNITPVVLEKSLAQLTINSTPSAADIYLNDRLIGRTPAELKELCSGEYHLVLKHTHGKFIKDIELKKEQHLRLDCIIKPTLAFLGIIPEKEEERTLISEMEEEVKELLLRIKSLNFTSAALIKVNSMLSSRGMNVLHLTKGTAVSRGDISDKKMVDAINYLATQLEVELLITAYMPKESRARTLFFSIISPKNAAIESFKVNLLSQLDTSNFVSKLNASIPLFKSWLGLKTIDTLLYDGIPVLSIAPDSPVEKAGINPGDIIETIDGEKITKTLDLLNYLKDKKADQRVVLGVKTPAGLENKEVTLGASPVEVPLNSAHLSYNRLMAEYRHLASISSEPKIRMLANYNLSLIFMHFGRWGDAIEQFKMATLKSQNGIGIGSLFYRMAQCYQKLGFNREAIAYYKEAMSYKNNTLNDNDGPLVAPLAERSLIKIEK